MPDARAPRGGQPVPGIQHWSRVRSLVFSTRMDDDAQVGPATRHGRDPQRQPTQPPGRLLRPPTTVTRVTRANIPMEWPWPERKATPAVLTWGGCHRRPPGGRRWASSTFTFVARCLFPWSARSECRNATHTASGLALVDWPRSVDRGALTASRWLVPGRHGGMIRPTLTGAAQDRAPGKQRLR